jgi:hypothetical protein
MSNQIGFENADEILTGRSITNFFQNENEFSKAEDGMIQEMCAFRVNINSLV